MANGDLLAAHRHKVDQATTDTVPQAFLPIRERDLFNLGSQPTIMGELNPEYEGPIILDFQLEEPELQSIMGDKVSPEIQ